MYAESYEWKENQNLTLEMMFNRYIFYLADVELLRKLIQNWGVTILVFFNNRDNQSD